MSNALLAGVAKVVITPPVGVDLCGFGGRGGPSVGVHDELQAGALFLSANEQALIITADLIGFDAAAVAEMRAEISATTGVPVGNICIACSHTHSGPVTLCLPTLGHPNFDYLAVLKRKLIGVAQIAVRQAAPAQIGYGREPVSVGIDRRKLSAGPTLDRAERGLVAPYVDVLAIDSAAGPALARLFVHAAHAVTLGGDNLFVSGDWPGYAQRTLEQAYGNGALALFGQGCCGNINSDPRGTFEIAEAQGRVMAGAVLKAAEYSARASDLTVAVASETLALPCFDPPTVAEAGELLAEARAKAAQPENNYGLQKMYDGLVEWAERMGRMAREGAHDLTTPFEVQVIRIGDIGLVALPGEVFVDYALQIDAGAQGYAQTATLGYANGNIGYVPNAAAFAEGGYEVDFAIRLYGDTMMRPESEKLIVNKALELLAQVR